MLSLLRQRAANDPSGGKASIRNIIPETLPKTKSTTRRDGGLSIQLDRVSPGACPSAAPSLPSRGLAAEACDQHISRIPAGLRAGHTVRSTGALEVSLPLPPCRGPLHLLLQRPGGTPHGTPRG